MRMLITSLFLLFVSLNGYPQTTIPLENVSKHFGDSVTIW